MSNYPAFNVSIDNNDGTSTPVVSTTISVYDASNNAALADTATDANGIVPAGSVAAAAGTLLRFSFALGNGICGYAEIFTTP